MKLLRSLDRPLPELAGGALAIGNFDGVHRGHAEIVRRLCARAQALGGPAVVFTFDPHPVRLLRPDAAPPPLTWTDRKAELLAELGVDYVIAYPTDEALLRLTPEAFFDRIVRERLAARALVEGQNFSFGRDRTGTIDVLRQLAAAAGIELEVAPPVIVDGEPVSSSRVRRLIAAGDVQEAAGLLTRPYRLRGMVVHGAARGAKLGFPTANLDAIDTLTPAVGVYAGLGLAASGRFPAAINIGPNPTFGEHAKKVEVHLVGASESLYGQPLEVDFLARLRDVRPFGNVEELLAQIRADVAAAERVGRQALGKGESRN
ncbi:MAG: bifunctional riboflavin kinase/FAD synthetase [Pirellulales bacterium]